MIGGRQGCAGESVERARLGSHHIVSAFFERVCSGVWNRERSGERRTVRDKNARASRQVKQVLGGCPCSLSSWAVQTAVTDLSSIPATATKAGRRPCSRVVAAISSPVPTSASPRRALGDLTNERHPPPGSASRKGGDTAGLTPSCGSTDAGRRPHSRRAAASLSLSFVAWRFASAFSLLTNPHLNSTRSCEEVPCSREESVGG